MRHDSLTPATNPSKIRILAVSQAQSDSYNHPPPLIHLNPHQLRPERYWGEGCRVVAAFLAGLLLFGPAALAQPTAPVAKPVTALFLSDIHLNPFHDPAFLATLTGQPAATAPPSPLTAAVQAYCHKLPDAPVALFRSSLEAMKPYVASVAFVTVGGDLLSHQFTRCFTALVLNTQPVAAEAAQYSALTPQQRQQYRDFVARVFIYVAAQLRDTFPNIPIYYALGNNDSACGDYNLDPADEFLRRTAPLVAAGINPTMNQAALPAQFERDGPWQAFGSYIVQLAALPNTHLIVFDDVFLAPDHKTCSGADDPATAKAELAWLVQQLRSLKPNEKVWLMGHIPPGLDLYASAKQRHPVSFLTYDLTGILAPHAAAIRLALFAHTHIDDLSQITFPDATHPIPLKSVQSISPDHGNPPTFTLAKIDPATSTLIEYTLITAVKSADIGDFVWPAPTAPPPPPTWSRTSTPPH